MNLNLCPTHHKPEISNAVSNGSLTYNTGKPCMRGHLSDRYTNGGGCIKCLREDGLEISRKHYRRYPWIANHKCVLRKARKLQATPPWSDLTTIKEFYKNCPPGFHVDHIIPLRHPEVSGLHVITNLQYLSAKDNLRKGNSFSRSA